ncbi:MAG: RNA polymerase sigma factor [Candidatus Limnocylindrales bacterium]
MDQELDAALIARSLDSPLVFGAVFDRHYDFVHRYLARRVGSDVADDLACETFTTALRVRARYDLEHSDARPWLLGIATNLIRHHRRAEVRRLRAYERLEVEHSAGIDEESVAARADAAAARPRIARALARIPDGDRDALLLLAWADLTYAEIALALGIPIGTVRSRIHRARRRLRELLDLGGQSLFADTITEVIASDG